MVENLTNRFWKFIKRPEGNAYDEAFTLEETPLVAPVDGQVIVKNQYLSLDAGTRMWITGREDGYQPPLDLNIPMVGLGVGEVIASSDPNFVEGDLVRGFGQWADYSVVTAELSGLMKLDKSIDDIRQHLGVLGFTGWTGMWGIMETGETVNWSRELSYDSPIRRLFSPYKQPCLCQSWRDYLQLPPPHLSYLLPLMNGKV